MLTTYIHLTYDLHKRKHQMYSCVATNCAGDELCATNCARRIVQATNCADDELCRRRIVQATNCAGDELCATNCARRTVLESLQFVYDAHDGTDARSRDSKT